MSHYRQETDAMGAIDVHCDVLWGAQTQRSLKYFDIGQHTMPKHMISAFGLVKKAACICNFQHGILNQQQHDLIVQACDEIIEGKHDAQFPLRIWQTGSGTQTNMNTNEVIANRCCQIAQTPLGSKHPIHPNDHVNASQSSNDTFPTAMRIAQARALAHDLLPALDHLIEITQKRQHAFNTIIKIGRTHLQDAVPLTLGQAFSAFLTAFNEARATIVHALDQLMSLPLGATAVGTGLNAPKDFDTQTADIIARETQLPFITADNKFAGLSTHQAEVLLASALKMVATAAFKMANDIRFLASGPRCGLGELILPANEPGSSIMPGKVNPTQCEAMTMVCLQVMANDSAVAMAASQGHFELNVYKPMILHNNMTSIALLSDACRAFADYAMDGLQANEQRIQSLLDESLMLVTALSPSLGYDMAAKIAHHAHEHDLTLKQACLDLGALSAQAFDEQVNPASMLGDSIQS